MKIFIVQLKFPARRCHEVLRMGPGPRDVNSGQLIKAYETSLKKLYDKEGDGGHDRKTKVPSVIWIEAVVKSFYPAGTTDKGSYDDTTFARELSFRAGFHIPKGKDNWIKDNKPRVYQDSIHVPRPEFGDETRVNINYTSLAGLQSLGLSDGQAQLILNELNANGLFKGADSFITRMKKTAIKKDSIDLISTKAGNEEILIETH